MKIFAAALCWLALASAGAAAADPPASPERTYLTGDWGGRRSALSERGLEPWMRYVAGSWSNVAGGLKRGTRYEGFAALGLAADLEALFGWRDTDFKVNGYYYHGREFTDEFVGAFPTQTASNLETTATLRVFEAWLRRSWHDGRFAVKLGKLAADDDFFVAENADALLNGTFGLFGPGRIRELTPLYPFASPGLHLYGATDDGAWVAQLGVYAADQGDDDRDNHGFDSTFEDGVTVLAELRTRRRPFGRPGSYALGISGTTADLEDFEDDRIASGTWAAYAVIDQMLTTDAPDRPGLGVFARGYQSADDDRSPISWYVDAGLKLTRPLPGRQRDVLTLGYGHIRFASDYLDWAEARSGDVSGREAVLELAYLIQVTDWLVLQPDFQLFLDPHFSGRDATVLGLRAVFEF